MKIFPIQITAVIISQVQFAVEAETEEEARKRLLNSSEGEPRQVREGPEERRLYFDEEVAPGLRDLAEHWESYLTLEEDYDGPC
jgi:hypothetical protein